MEKIQFDSGVKSYKLGCGQLRFNPGDPNVYVRFMDACDSFRSIEKDLIAQAQCVREEDLGTAAVNLLQAADKQMKSLFNQVFPGNDFDKLLGGVNLLAATGSGERVVSHLFAALEPVLVDGARRCAGQLTDQARGKAQARRQSQ